MFRQSGAKHDGFALWPSEHADADWSRPRYAVSAGPRRDVLGDLTEDGARSIRSQHMQPQFKDLVTRSKPSPIFAYGEWDMTS